MGVPYSFACDRRANGRAFSGSVYDFKAVRDGQLEVLDVGLFDLGCVLMILIQNLPLIKRQYVFLKLKLTFILLNLWVLQNMELLAQVKVLLLVEDLSDLALHLT